MLRTLRTKLKSKTPNDSELDEFGNLKKILTKYNVHLYYKDSMDILVGRAPTDNFESIFKTGYPCDAFPMMEALDKKFKNLNVVFDVGANIGITTVWMARKAKKVYAFEPEPNNVKRLQDTLEVNHLNNVTTITDAISDKEGTSTLNILEGYGHHSLGPVKTSKFVGKMKVKTTTLDNFCKKHKIKEIDLLKVDIEGFEEELFKGASNMLRAKKIKFIVFEISKVPLESLGKSPQTIFDLLSEYDYKIYDLNSKRVTKTNLDDIFHADLVAKPA